MMDEDIVFPIMNVSCNYKEPARFDDTINIETYLVKMTRAQMVFKYRMRRASDGALLATGETKNAFMSKSSGKDVYKRQSLHCVVPILPYLYRHNGAQFWKSPSRTIACEPLVWYQYVPFIFYGYTGMVLCAHATMACDGTVDFESPHSLARYLICHPIRC